MAEAHILSQESTGDERVGAQNQLLAELHRERLARRHRKPTQTSLACAIAMPSNDDIAIGVPTPAATPRPAADEGVRARLVELGFSQTQVLQAAERKDPLSSSFEGLLDSLLAEVDYSGECETPAAPTSQPTAEHNSTEAAPGEIFFPLLDSLIAEVNSSAPVDLDAVPAGIDQASQHSRTNITSTENLDGSNSSVQQMIQAQLVGMGFSQEQVNTVLQDADAGVDIELLIQRLLEMDPPEPQSRATSSAAAPVQWSSLPAANLDSFAAVESMLQPPLLGREVPVPSQDLDGLGVPASVLQPPSLGRDLSVPSQGILSGLIAQHGEGSRRAAVRALLSLKIATRQGVISPGDRLALLSDLKEGHLDLVSELVQGLGIREAPYLPLAENQTEWECVVCFDVQDTLGWACPYQHRFCADCIRQHVESVTYPRCPQIGCTYELEDEDLTFLEVDSERLESFRNAKLQGALNSEEGGETMMRCPRPTCSNIVVIPAGERMRFHCVCGIDPFCTMCRQSPYHYHVECGRVQALREKWLAWIKAEDALQASIRAHEQVCADEKWKAENCRLCPHCSRPISKVEGCDSMVCGRAYHGGDEQPGCGKSFDWKRAKKYEAVLTQRRVVHESHEETKARAAASFHPFATCSLCGTSGIRGLRFRCIHCESFNACSNCESRIAEEHPSEHVFDVMVEAGFQWNHLPAGTRVKLVRCEDRLPQSWLHGRATRNATDRTAAPKARAAAPAFASMLEGRGGSIVSRWAGPPFGYTVRADGMAAYQHIPAEHVEPVLANQAEARKLLRASEVEERRKKPIPALVAVPRPPPTALVATSRVRGSKASAHRRR